MAEGRHTDTARRTAQSMLDYIDASPSPWHAVERAAAMLDCAGFARLREADDWPISPGSSCYVIRDDSSLIAFRVGERATEGAGWRMVAAHTDSPGLRIKPRAPHARGPMAVLGVEVYGGPILATFADRDLTLAGRVFLRGKNGLQSRLVNFSRPLLRLPNVAIHLNRNVNDEGLKFDRQEELPLLLAALDGELPPDSRFRALLADTLDVDGAEIVSWGLAAADTQSGSFFGAEQEFVAAARLDNLASCHAALNALIAAPAGSGVQVCALFDHEEVGSQSYKGAAGTFLENVLARVSDGLGVNDSTQRRALARSWLLSADMAHAFHPSYARLYEPQHHVLVNAGPVIKINVNQRYATDEQGEAYFADLCQRVDVPCQRYVHRTNLPCGSTIGPIMATRLGVRTVDVGNAMWSMHSIRESAGALDQERMTTVLRTFYSDWA